MSSTPFTNPLPPDPDRVRVDRSIVAAALFLSMFTPDEWRRLGPDRLAEFVTWIAAEPACRIGEMAAFLDTRAAAVLPPAELARLSTARRHAGRVLAVLAN